MLSIFALGVDVDQVSALKSEHMFDVQTEISRTSASYPFIDTSGLHPEILNWVIAITLMLHCTHCT